MLRFGGIENSPPKTDQTPNRFRVARNFLPTPEGTLIPRYDLETPLSQPSGAVRSFEHIANYNNQPLFVTCEDYYSFGVAGGEEYSFFLNTARIPRYGSLGQCYGFTVPQSIQSIRKNNTTYFLNGYVGELVKYDGVEMGPAGCPAPRFCVANADLAGTRFLRAVVHTMDFDKNEPVSQWVQFSTGAAGITNMSLSAYVPAGYTYIPTNTVAGITPTSVPIETLPTSYYIASAVTYAAGEFTVTTVDTNISAINIGSYIFVAGDSATVANIFGGAPPATYLGMALKIKSVSPLRLDATDAKLMTTSREWVTTNISAFGVTVAAGLQVVGIASRYYLTFWESTSSTGVYYSRGQFQYLPSSTAASALVLAAVTTTGTAVATYNTSTSMFTMSDVLNDWYDVTSVKISPNAFYDFGGSPVGMTKFGDLLLYAREDYIWASDTTSGGWFEQFNLQNSFLIGDAEYGRITAICATEDFLFVGRERKNYYVTGNLITGNYSVQEIEEAEIGPWCNNSAIAIKNTVYFITAIGIFQVFPGGRCVNLTSGCSKFFETYTANAVNEDVVFKMSGTHSKLSVPYNNASELGLAVGYDEFRELLVWMKREEGNPCIVVHTKTGEIYEWTGIGGLTTSDVFSNCISFISAYYYIGLADNSFPYSTLSTYGKELKGLRYYQENFPCKLYTTWLTAGEPSLEKEVLQLKLFGRISALPDWPLKIKHYKDWDITTEITNTTYVQREFVALDFQTQYSHKKRLNSDKCLAVSVGIEIDTFEPINMELESIEVEFNSIQSGMKR